MTISKKPLSQLLSEIKERQEKAQGVVKAAIDLRNSGYDGPFIGEVCSPLFSAIAAYESEQLEPKDGERVRRALESAVRWLTEDSDLYDPALEEIRAILAGEDD